MRVGIFLNTPAQVYFWDKIAEGLEKRGHEFMFLARDKGETIKLLNELGISYLVYSERQKSKYRKITTLPLALFKAIYQNLRFKPDIITGFGIYSTLSSLFLRKPCIVFTDSEPRVNISLSIQFKLFIPFPDIIITPTSFLDDLGPKQIRINSCKEMAYLHPDYYKPNKDIFDLLKLRKNEDYAVVRFNNFDATHDVGVKGFQLKDKIDLINMLSEYTKVFVSFEGSAPKEIERYKLKIPINRIHDVLYYAQIFVCDTQTMATEAAILGTPVVRSNSFVGKKDMGNFIELEEKYGLIFNIRDPKIAIRKAEELIQIPNLKRDWLDKKEKMLEDKCDITKFMISFIENYPQSFKDIKETPSIFGSNV